MIDGANFDQDEVERFGDPWHGLFRGGVLELPNGTTRAMVAAPGRGDSYKIAIPGQPAVTTSTADAAAGMTWLNYGVMTGENRALYGVDLGALRWIYIDADNTPWLADINVYSGNLTVTLKNFGEIGGPPVSYVSSSVAIDYFPGDSVPTGTLLKIDDINSNGGQVALVADQVPEIGLRKIWRMWQVALSGPAATFSISATAIDISPVVSSTTTYPGEISYLKEMVPPYAVTGPFLYTGGGAPPGFQMALMNSDYVATYRVETAVGATFHADVFEIVRWVSHTISTVTHTHDLSALFVPGYGYDLTANPFYGYWVVPGYFNQDFNGSYYGLEVAGSLYQFAYEGELQTTVIAPATGWGGGIVDGWVSAPAIGGFTIINPYHVNDYRPEAEYFNYTVTRETNRVYRLSLDRMNASTLSYSTLYPREFIGFAGPVSGYTNPTDYWSPSACGYATAHYDTGALVTSMSGVVCFV